MTYAVRQLLGALAAVWLFGSSTAWAQVALCRDALVQSTYRSSSLQQTDWRLAELVSEGQYKKIRQEFKLDTEIYGVPIGVGYGEFQSNISNRYQSRSERLQTSQLENIAWTKLDAGSPEAYAACLKAQIFSLDGLRAAPIGATESDISIAIRWSIPGDGGAAFVKWQPDSVMNKKMPTEIPNGQITIIVPRPLQRMQIAANFKGYDTGPIVLEPLPVAVDSGPRCPNISGRWKRDQRDGLVFRVLQDGCKISMPKYAANPIFSHTADGDYKNGRFNVSVHRVDARNGCLTYLDVIIINATARSRLTTIVTGSDGLCDLARDYTEESEYRWIGP